jgi:3-deoxy-manno-octulosonate cytidylyltransferase (CMP-KDO synthetase)
MIIIPARLKSTRLPNKVLAKIGETPMVIKTAQRVKELDSVVIATDSKEVLEVAKEYDIDAILTSSDHKSGTDRIYEAAKKLNLADNEAIINVQADEPFIEQDVVSKLIELTKKYADTPDIIATTCYKLIDSNHAQDPNIVKVVTNLNNMALYFSRLPIPYARESKLDSYKAHLGLYGFTMQKLEQFCHMGSGILEDIEKLEQLRILDNGYKIALVEVVSSSFGIDTPQDLERAQKMHTL